MLAPEVAPDWTIEIISPEQSPTRIIDKILFCPNHGAELGWLIDSQERLIMIFQPGQQPEMKQKQDILKVLSVSNRVRLIIKMGVWGMPPSPIFDLIVPTYLRETYRPANITHNA
ncbi:Uma2 family endonuclease [Leptolyngbya sp. 'hensonii']|uniref:Uma2 family endonuclease n=1 Tax=Leptolyngbya sp. 'hensonii' TaxID=1922337 RepID=UPI000A92C6D3|nr:Uma2 family endonuclease [Leptolyngbya sp. 'hensonii']